MNSLQELRKRHLQNLFSNFKVKKVKEDEYRVLLNSGFEIILQLSKFPETSPEITLLESSHAKFTPNFKIQNWNLHTSLVGILNEINNEFLKDPPVKTNVIGQPQNSHITQVRMNLDLEELKELDTDVLAFDDYFENLENVKCKQEEVDGLFLKNYNLALGNKEKEKEYFKKIADYQELFVLQGEYRKEFDSQIYNLQNKVLVILFSKSLAQITNF
jgi:hypothetical protein